MKPDVSGVSVIIPNFNRADLIGETISNLLIQSQPPFEIIVIDDGSTDKSIEIIRKYGDKVRLIQQTNQGPGAARNAGLRIARGKFIQFQDSDDLLSLNKLEEQTQILDETGADIAFGPWAHVTIRDRQVEFESRVLQQSLPPKSVDLSSWLLRGWMTIFQSLLFRRTFLVRAGEYRTDVRYGEDMEFFLRLLFCSPEVAFAPDVLTLYRVNAQNKLSHDDGWSKSRREIDWAQCLMSMVNEKNLYASKVDWFTQWVFLSNIRKHLRYVKKSHDAPAHLIQSLTEETKKLPAGGLALTEFGLRLLERLRLLCFGRRWMSALQAAPPTPQQFKLINNLGFKTG